MGTTHRWSSRLPFYYGWLIVGIAFVTMAIGVTARTAFSLLLPPLIDEFGWDRGLVAGAFSFGFLVSAALSPIAGRLMDRHGPRIVIGSGVCLMTAGLLMAPTIEKPWQLYATLGVLVGSGANLMSFTAQSLFLPNWFVRRRGLAISIAFSGSAPGRSCCFPGYRRSSAGMAGAHRVGPWVRLCFSSWVRSICSCGGDQRTSGCWRTVDRTRQSARREVHRTLSIPLGRPSNGRSHVQCAPAASGGSCSRTSAPSSPGTPYRFTRRNILSKSGSVPSLRRGLWGSSVLLPFPDRLVSGPCPTG
jgi:hypothetical protein